MKLNTYLSFGGQCEAAFNFYVEHLGAEITAMMTFSDGPPEAAEYVPAEWRDKIMHASLTIDGHELMGTDGMGEDGVHTGVDAPRAAGTEGMGTDGVCAGGGDAQVGIKGAHVVIHADDPAEAERIYNVLSEGGTVEMPMDKTFFASRFGMAVDRFGVPWMVLCE